MDQAFAHKNVEGVYAYFSPDFYRIGSDGKHYTIANDRPGTMEMLKNLRTVHATSVVTDCRVHGSTATVTVDVRAVLVVNDPRNSGSPTHIDDSETRHQTWTRSGSKWLMLTSAAKPQRIVIRRGGAVVQTIVDGKVQSH
jgi:hypothetical protein